jgi:pimeloyl-ACP methyl ester carboxylesterase/DNA-binding SARP family transcriptional activator
VTWHPPIRYAPAHGADLAYQLFGDGTVDVVCIPPMAQNIELAWERPEFAAMLNRFGSFARVLHFDKRGTGASDRTVAVPTLDQRVDDTQAVMDAAGIERAVMYGLSEGGPMAILFAATYPERVTSLVLHATAAVFVPADESESDRTERLAWDQRFIDGWGTEQSVTLELFAPGAADNPSYRAWEPRYERQSATPRGIAELMSMLDDIDVTPLLGDISVPTLVVHRRGDRIVSVADAEVLADRIPGARLAVFDGDDHFPHIGDTTGWLDAVEEFITGTAPIVRSSGTFVAPRPHVEICTLGGFTVRRDGCEMPSSSWGSRRARQLCKRLAAAAGNPVPREELIDILWPDVSEPIGKLGARLSVQLSSVRRVLGGGVIADRSSVRIDPTAVTVDLVVFQGAVLNRDDTTVLSTYRGGFLPEDIYEDWTTPIRDKAKAAFVAAAHRLTASAHASNQPSQALQYALEWLAVDHYDEQAHHATIRAHLALGQHHDARRSHAVYQQRMAELGATSLPLAAINITTRQPTSMPGGVRDTS